MSEDKNPPQATNSRQEDPGKKKKSANTLKHSNETVPLKEKMDLEVSSKQESSLAKANETTGKEDSESKVVKKAPNNGKNVKASKGKAGKHSQIKTSTPMKINEERETASEDDKEAPGKKKKSQGVCSKRKLGEDSADDQGKKRPRGPSKRGIIQGYRIFC